LLAKSGIFKASMVRDSLPAWLQVVDSSLQTNLHHLPPFLQMPALYGSGFAMLLCLFMLFRWLVRAGKPTSSGGRRWALLAVSPKLQNKLQPRLHAKGWEEEVLPRKTTLREFLMVMQPTLLVIEQEKQYQEFLELLQYDAIAASTPALVLSDEPVALPAAVVRRQMPRNASLKEILQAIEELSVAVPSVVELSRRHRLEARLHQGALLEWLHFLAHTSRTGCLDVRGELGKGRIWLKLGQITHAQLDQEKGADALNRLLQQKQGTFSFRNGATTSQNTVKEATLFLLHEYTRLRDEDAKNSGT
jgi:hypothetical protein